MYSANLKVKNKIKYDLLCEEFYYEEATKFYLDEIVSIFVKYENRKGKNYKASYVDEFGEIYSYLGYTHVKDVLLILFDKRWKRIDINNRSAYIKGIFCNIYKSMERATKWCSSLEDIEKFL